MGSALQALSKETVRRFETLFGNYFVFGFVWFFIVGRTWMKDVCTLDKMLATQSKTINMWILVLSFLRMITPVHKLTTKVKINTIRFATR